MILLYDYSTNYKYDIHNYTCKFSGQIRFPAFKFPRPQLAQVYCRKIFQAQKPAKQLR